MNNDGSPSKALFVHEATHAYQYQKGVAVKSLRLSQPGKHASYSYFPFPNDKSFSDYGIEQQAMLVEDYYRVRNGAVRLWDCSTQVYHAAPLAQTYRNIIPFNK